MINENLALEKELEKLENELNDKLELEEQQESKAQELDYCLTQIKELAEQLKKDESFKKYGYVLKQDLVNVYKNKRNLLEEMNSEETTQDDVLLLIQAP